MPDWLTLNRGDAPLLVSLPHTGTDLPPDIAAQVVDPWLARKDADWWIDRLYGFAADLGATVLRTAVSRTAVDVNRDPSGVSLYPGQATTGLCPTTTFDGEPLYPPGREPDAAEIARRRTIWFDPYHVALAGEIARLRERHDRIVVYDCHSIRSAIPRLFDGELPNLNIGTNGGASCDPALERLVVDACAASLFSHVLNGRFRGGYITRHYARPGEGVHTVQMELACRGYMAEPVGPVSPATWPTPYDEASARPMRDVLAALLERIASWAVAGGQR